MADPARYMAAGLPVEAANLIANDINAATFTNGGTIKVTLGTAPLVLNGNTGTVPSPTPTAALQVIGGDGVGINVDGYGYGGGFFYQGWRYDGTQASSTAVVSGDVLVGIGGWGFDGTNFGASVPADLTVNAAESFTPTAHGTYFRWRVTAAGTTTKTEAMRLQASGILTIGATAASGAAKLQVTGSALVDVLEVGISAGPTITSGSGAPSATQPNGSLYLRTDGAANTRLYVSEGGGTWAAVSSA